MDELTSMHKENNQLYVDMELVLNITVQLIINSNQQTKRTEMLTACDGGPAVSLA